MSQLSTIHYPLSTAPAPRARGCCTCVRNGRPLMLPVTLLDAIAAVHSAKCKVHNGTPCFDYHAILGHVRNVNPSAAEDMVFNELHLRNRLRRWSDIRWPAGQILIVVEPGARGWKSTIYTVGPMFLRAREKAIAEQVQEQEQELSRTERAWREIRESMPVREVVSFLDL